MKKLLMLAAAVALGASPVSAAQYDASGKAYDTECRNFNNILDQADCGIKVVLEWAEKKNGGKIPMRVINDANGHIAAMVDEKGNMLISNPLHRPGDPMAFFRYVTPPGQLAACDSAEVMQTLARIAKTPINWIFDPKTLGSNDTKNFCSVTDG